MEQRPAEVATATGKDFTAVPFSTLTCPSCGHQSREEMAEDACAWFYACKGCAAVLSPKPGDCCVFCSYGDMPCPSIQEAGAQAMKTQIFGLPGKE